MRTDVDPDSGDALYAAGLGGSDPAGFATALVTVGVGLAGRPWVLPELVASLAGIPAAAAAALVGPPQSGDDRRFADRAWRENPMLRSLVRAHREAGRWLQRAVERSGAPPAARRKAEFVAGMLTDSLAPSNIPWLNPAVVKEAIDTGGMSVLRGLRNAAGDLLHNGGRPRQVDVSGFEVGRTLAATPGTVVMRNSLIELIAYRPQTETVHEVPLLINPPWINKYYILDLAPGRSLIEYAVAHGLTVFVISYRDADAGMGSLTMDDYLRDGLLAALAAVEAMTRAPRVNLLGLCLGGLYCALLLGHLAARGELDRVGCVTLTNTMLDFTDPGVLGVFTDERSVGRLERRMAQRGYLRASDLQQTFDVIRANDLIWNYVVSNWYMGKEPPAFDVLAWNRDSTNMPARMHTQYLRACYIENRIAEPGAFSICGSPISLDDVTTPLYLLAAENDHIVPWRSSYRTTGLWGGPVRFALSNGGHIAGVVNPPTAKNAVYRVGDGTYPPDPDQWLRESVDTRASWWTDWLDWVVAASGPQVGARELRAGEPAPGRYVRGETGPPIEVPIRSRGTARAGQPRPRTG